MTMNEPHFMGHFPGNPVMPGVLIIEALAQTGPASRGDVGVVSKHLAMLEDNKELSEVYSVLSNYILKNRE